ncbi:DUF4127 family protein [Paenibacillus sp. HJL G12]|uniref:DUF4127 family protein n=1 Tax=Paenibacillus dendrobii TaxID=2691084 RepID=A0A7X3IK78_9BACL|nr:DUF4127 family protein [Paenibacillus dendrobii]MWV45494.1 DUF4127 family protein [Paenibacillus dendrobii]
MGKLGKIAFVPLDERPCNYEFPYLLAQGTEIELVRPPIEMMGLKKRPGDTHKLWSWLEEQAADADGAIIALDTLLYGGIIPSRLHSMEHSQVAERLQKLRSLKERNPNLKIFAFQLIMRCPQYSIADEEPDYYADWGREIFRQGYIGHKRELGIASAEDLEELEEIGRRLPSEIMDDYMLRRSVNIDVIQDVLGWVTEGWIDFMIFPQDDSAPFGHTAKDQQRVRAMISELDLELKTYMYPGADEAGCTLLARMINDGKGRIPLVYPRMAAVQGPFVTPLYEDRFFYESLKYQILAAGGLIAASAEEADLVLLVNTPGETMMEADSQEHPFLSYDVYRNIIELVEYGNYTLVHKGKPVAVADVGYANGADRKLVKLLKQKEMLFELAGYAGWNTSSNSLGTVIAQSMLYLHYGRTAQHLDFLSLRYAEDLCYCSVVRMGLNQGEVEAMGFSKFELDGRRGEVSRLVKQQIAEELDKRINGPQGQVEITDCYMPWNRTFEVGLSVRYHSST